ncbi:MAG: hypothetical protein ABFD62_01715 [Syntrophaceae bacterium]
MELCERTVMDNGLVLEIWDESRKIADDTFRVTLAARVKVAVKKEYLPDLEHYRTVLRVFGHEILFEQVKERSFVRTDEKDEIYNQLLGEFRDTTLKYISRPNFPAGFVMSKFMEIQRNPYKYKN